MGCKSYRDLEVWQNPMGLVIMRYQIAERLDSIDFHTVKQIMEKTSKKEKCLMNCEGWQEKRN